jgi:type II secretory pathway component GspD/PulD (secretin)
VISHTPLRKTAAIALAYFFLAGVIGSQSGPQSAAQQSPPPQAGAPQPKPQKKVAPSPALAKKALLAGRIAEQNGKWQAAYDAYMLAVAYAPNDPTAQFLVEFARYHLAQEHMEAAEREALAGNVDRASAEAHLAVGIDPSYTAARERLSQIESLNAAHNQALLANLAGPVTLKPQGGTHTFDLRGDIRIAYSELANQFGLSVNFDPDLPNRATRFRAPNVDFETAAHILAEETRTFWTPIDEHTIYVAEDTQAKRKQYERVVTQTFFLPNSLTDAEMADTIRLVREMTGITATSFNSVTREITLKDSPQKIGVAEKLIREIDQGRGEVILEFDLLEVDQNEAQILGVAPPNSASIVSLSQAEVKQIETSQTTQQLIGIIQSIFGSGVGGGALGGLLPPLIAFGGGKTFYLSTLPSATVNYSQTFSLVRSAQRVIMRSQNAKPASFFLGTHYPITLASLSANLATTAAIQSALPVSNLLAAAGPSGVVTTSLRGNGKADIISTNQGANSISVFLGNGDGTFAARTDIPVGNGPVALVTADFNGDGKPDLAVVNKTDETVSILLGNGDGTFTAGPVLVTGHSPVAILSADFNSDTHQDLAVVNSGDNSVSIFLGDGAGNFHPAPTPLIATGVNPQGIATGDFNSDSHPDLAVTNQNDNTVSVFRGKGDGTFSAKADFATGNEPTGIVSGNFNGDAFPDIALTNQSDNTISILLGNGDGTFQAQTAFPTGKQPVAILTGDFNGDGIPDLVTANETDNTATVLIGSGQGTFNGFVLAIPVGAGPVALATADFNGDTLADLAVADQSANLVTVILNTPSLNSSTPTIPTQVPYPGSEYEDIGLKIKATPHMHPGGNVTLELSLTISSLAGTSVNNIPVITNRQYEQTISAKQDESTLLSGLIDREETLSISGLPGLALIPGAGLLMGTRNPTKTDTQLLILITPRIARPVSGTGHTIYAGKDTTGRAGQP